MISASYLLELDGSFESRAAAYLTWELAKKTGARVVAQHVVDTTAIWRFLSYDLAGFVGSGLYMSARERITETMQSIGEEIMLSYSSQIGGQPLEFENYIDEGDLVTEIARRARYHDLVVIGHHRRRSNPERQRMPEKLAEACPCPILVVGNAGQPWSKMQIFITNDIAGSEEVLGLGPKLGLPMEIYLDSNVSQTDSVRISQGGWSSASVQSIRRSSFNRLVTGAPGDAMLVVCAESVAGPNSARYRTRLRAFLDQSEGRSLLLWRQRAASREHLALPAERQECLSADPVHRFIA